MAKLKRQPVRVTAREIGLGGYLYIADIDDFLVLQKPASIGAGTTVGDEATITSDHTFKTSPTGLGFIKIPLLGTNKGKLDFKTTGEYPAKTSESMIEALTVGTNAEQIEMVKRLKGREIIALIEDAECGDERVFQVGCDCKKASLDFEYTTSNNEMKITVKAACLPNVYDGLITLMS